MKKKFDDIKIFQNFFMVSEHPIELLRGRIGCYELNNKF
jgi:hypothetical protein